MQKETMIFISGKLTAISTLIQSVRGRYISHPDFDKNLSEAIYAINRAEAALEKSGAVANSQPTEQAQNSGTAGTKVGYLGNINSPGCDPDVP